VLHLLYARFWHMALYDAGVIETPEPFTKLVHQGMILGELEFVVDGKRVDEDLVEKRGDKFVLRSDPGKAVEARSHKMSKCRGNGQNIGALPNSFDKIFQNSTTGAFTLTIRTNVDAGIVLAQTMSQAMWSDGTTMFAVSAAI
jgi:hypothetical protein